MATITKTIAIVGASGIQGSSVARAFLALPNWHVRCLTRDPSSAKMQPLARLGGEIVQAELGDATSLDRAFAGAHAIFVNTSFWETFVALQATGSDSATNCFARAYEAEVAWGRNAADAAARVPTLERFVYSTLGPIKQASGGKYARSFHWESKAAVVEYVRRQQPALAAKMSLIQLCCYATNRLLYPVRDPASDTDKYILRLPRPASAHTVIPVINTQRTTGAFVRALVEDEAPGTVLEAYDDKQTAGDLLATWSRVRGRPATIVTMDLDAMCAATGTPPEILEGIAYLGEFDYMSGMPDFIEPAQLKKPVDLQSFEEYLRTEGAEEAEAKAKAGTKV